MPRLQNPDTAGQAEPPGVCAARSWGPAPRPRFLRLLSSWCKGPEVQVQKGAPVLTPSEKVRSCLPPATGSWGLSPPCHRKLQPILLLSQELRNYHCCVTGS